MFLRVSFTHGFLIKRGELLRVWVRLLPIGPIDNMPKDVYIMQLFLGSNMSMAVCLGDISVFLALCHMALGEVFGFEIVLDIFLA